MGAMLRWPGARRQVRLCWAHVRRRFFELAKSGAAPAADDVLERIAQLYAIKAELCGQSPANRKVGRQEQSRAIIDSLHGLHEARLTQISRKSAPAGAIRHALTRWTD